MGSKSKVRCPKCRSNYLFIHEVWIGHCVQFYQENGLIDKKEGVMEPGSPYKLQAECDKCHHTWTIRSGFQIDHVLINQTP